MLLDLFVYSSNNLQGNSLFFSLSLFSRRFSNLPDLGVKASLRFCSGCHLGSGSASVELGGFFLKPQWQIKLARISCFVPASLDPSQNLLCLVLQNPGEGFGPLFLLF